MSRDYRNYYTNSQGQVVCPDCGVVVGNTEIHDNWHTWEFGTNE